MWNPNLDGINELIKLFKNSSSSDNEMQKEIFIVSKAPINVIYLGFPLLLIPGAGPIKSKFIN